MIKNYNAYINKNINEIFPDVKLESKCKQIEINIIISYQNEFETSIHNVRCEHQKGSFLMYGNIVKDNVITSKLNYIKDTEKYLIKSEDKIKILYDLSVNKKINYSYIYPDSKQAIRIEVIKNKKIKNCRT